MLQIYNTLTRKKEDFLSTDTTIRMFVCGPTVYDYIHIGNARTYVIFDMIAKYLRYKGYKLNYIQNITDIEDKIMLRAQEQNRKPLEFAKKYEQKFLEDVKTLKIDSVDLYPKSTDYIKQIQKQIQTLMDKGHTYVIEGDGIYMDLSTVPDYGKLAGRTVEMGEDAVSRIDNSPNKRNKGDFVLWKHSKPGEPTWDAKFKLPDGSSVEMSGRPGWNIEDTAMTEKQFGQQYELHGGAIDLIFPHHEGEIAIQESASGLKPFVKYWMHAGFLNMKQNKMSKSKGNFLTAHEALKKYSPETLRHYFLSAHYRSPLEYNVEIIENYVDAQVNISHFVGLIKFIEDQKIWGEEDKSFQSRLDIYKKNIEKAINNDFNTAEALGLFSRFSSEVEQYYYSDKKIDKNAHKKIEDILYIFDEILGIIPKLRSVPEDIKNSITEHDKARAAKKYDESDKIREKIELKGFEVKNTTHGTIVIPGIIFNKNNK